MALLARGFQLPLVLVTVAISAGVVLQSEVVNPRCVVGPFVDMAFVTGHLAMLALEWEGGQIVIEFLLLEWNDRP